jgi:putative SOS response-associated peptidase YedK
MSGRSREVELAAARWGFVPHWWKEAKPPRTSLNAVWKRQRRSRCGVTPFGARGLVPAEGLV